MIYYIDVHSGNRYCTTYKVYCTLVEIRCYLFTYAEPTVVAQIHTVHVHTLLINSCFFGFDSNEEIKSFESFGPCR